MRYQSILLSIAAMVLVSLMLFRFYEREMTEMWLNLAIHPEIQQALAQSAEDQKVLARLDGEQNNLYRARFDDIQNIRNNLNILSQNREELQSHFKYALWLLFASIITAAALIHWISQRRVRLRIERLQAPLTDLAFGKTDIRITEKRNDAIGRIAAMIEKTSRLMAKQRDQLRYLDHLSNWQEASRRNAHEIRTPLTAARMEVERLLALAERAPAELRQSLEEAAASIIEELDRLKRFTKEFTAFAKVRKPAPTRVDLSRFVGDFVALFGASWENLTLSNPENQTPVPVEIDREMVRQVLVNLCNNSALAMAKTRGRVSFEIQERGENIVLRVADNGPGVEPSIRHRIFEPYTTTRKVGAGMGLGLAISRKIMLDHGGDLELYQTSTEGVVFHLLIPKPEPRKELEQ